jgi:hypothetical protein
MPSMYLYELVNWLTTVVDSLAIQEAYKDEAYRGAVSYIAECLIVSCWVNKVSVDQHQSPNNAWFADLPDWTRRLCHERQCDFEYFS